MILTEEQMMIREMARDFATEQLAPNSEEWDRECRFPKEAIDAMAQLGMMGMMVPPEWDGAGTDTVSYAMALEEIAAGDGSVSTIMSVHNSVGCMPVLRYGTDEQKERFLKPLARGEIHYQWIDCGRCPGLCCHRSGCGQARDFRLSGPHRYQRVCRRADRKEDGPECI